MKFPKPWKIERTGPGDCVVTDANDRKLFYIVGDDFDEDREATVLFYSDDDADTEMLLNEIEEVLGRLT